MGLLEKALRYKNKIVSNGKKSIMDRIAFAPKSESLDSGILAPGSGPDPASFFNDDIVYLKKEDLVEVKADAVNNFLFDYMALFELSRDILRAESETELFDVLLFSIMGQIGVSSSSIMTPGKFSGDRWVIAESRGVTLPRDEPGFLPTAGILGQVISRKEIIDIEEFKDDARYLDDYYAYIAVDGRILVPVMNKNEVMAVIILGNKLTAEDYTAEEKDFLAAIAEFSAYSYRTILLKGGDTAIPEKSKEPGFDEIQEKIMSYPDGDSVRDMIRDKFRNMGVESFAVFIRDEFSGEYALFACEAEDRLRLGSVRYRIPSNASLITEIAKTRTRLSYKDLDKPGVLAGAFPRIPVKKFPMLSIVSFQAAGELIGFTIVFSVWDSSHDEIPGSRIARFCNFIFPYIHIAQNIEYRRGNYVDSIERILSRMDEEIRYASDLKIPLALIVIIVKNYKRLLGIFGNEKAREMFRHVESFIKARLSGRDFSVRYDRNKILIVLPGRDKRYAVPLANTIINEMVHGYSTRHVQLLITFMTAEFPLDGKDSYSLIDAVS